MNESKQLPVKVEFAGGKRIHAQVGDYLIQTDQPLHYGGEARHPAPFDLFLASIATCAGIYAWNFCEMRRLPTEGLDLEMSCIDDEEKEMIGEISFKLTLPQGFPDKYRHGILRAMQQCTVKRHMQHSPAFSIEIVE